MVEYYVNLSLAYSEWRSSARSSGSGLGNVTASWCTTRSEEAYSASLSLMAFRLLVIMARYGRVLANSICRRSRNCIVRRLFPVHGFSLSTVSSVTTVPGLSN